MRFFQKVTFYHLVLVFYLGIIFYVLPWEHIFNTLPSTGGDVGTHFYPLHAILKSHSIRPWNPGNLGGEPLLVHYFPFPFIIMALFSIFLPSGLVFNWLYVLPVYAMPFCIYYFLKKVRAPTYSPEIGFLISIIFIFNTSYYAWGGNIFSLLSGQFNHSYALCFLFLWMGLTVSELDKKELISYKQIFLVVAIILSHAYIALSLPVASAFIFLFSRPENYLKTIKRIILNGTLGTGLTLWWLIPFLTNSKWTTPYGSNWLDHLNYTSYLPTNFIFISIIGIIVITSVLSNLQFRDEFLKSGFNAFSGLIILAIFYFLLIKIFPLIGLVDIRAIPQVQLFAGLALSITIGLVINFCSKKVRYFILVLSLILTFFGSSKDIVKVKTRMQWNWSGWHSKPAHNDFINLNKTLAGDFSKPRVAFEHSSINRAAGTLRAFEMLPYFAGRSTTEGLYMQATHYSPLAFYFQSLLGPHKSCPFPNYPCENINFKKASKLMSLLGIQELIVSSKEALASIEKLPEDFQFIQKFGPWSVFKSKQEVSLVEIMSKEIKSYLGTEWKNEGIKYVINGNENAPWFFVPQWTNSETQKILQNRIVLNSEHCRPELKMTWNKINLRTNCPGFPHIIKVSFHPSFRANTNDPIFLTLPNYIGIIPSQSEVNLEFGQSLDWKISGFLSYSVFLFLIIYFIRKKNLSTNRLSYPN